MVNKRIQHQAAYALPATGFEYGHPADLAVGLHSACSDGVILIIPHQHLQALRILAVDFEIGRYILADHKHVMANSDNLILIIGILYNFDSHRTYVTFTPNGVSAIPASLRCCLAKGSPMMVIAHSTPNIK